MLAAVAIFFLPALAAANWLAQDDPLAVVFGPKRRWLQATRVDFPGDMRPAFQRAAETGLRDSDVVIGVVAFGEAKAFSRSAVSAPGRHLVHSRFGQAQVTVTHCSRTRFTRVFSATDDQDLSQLHCGGWLDEQEMALLFGETRFPHSSKLIPFDEVPFVVTTWGKWRRMHPETTVYEGKQENADSTSTPQIEGETSES